jgi:hypothetical protein
MQARPRRRDLRGAGRQILRTHILGRVLRRTSCRLPGAKPLANPGRARRLVASLHGERREECTSCPSEAIL